jgi:SMC interacting uncharacterized protein involved in chromosome segregation
MTNPLIDKYFELYPEKKEEPKVIKAEDYEGEITLAQVENAFKKWDSVASNLTTPSVATSNTGITKASTIKSYDKHSANDAFLELAEKVKNGTAQVKCVSIEVEHCVYKKNITFEVYDYEP